MSRKEQWLSRIAFYSVAIASLWVVGRLSPTSAEIAAKYDRDIGAGEVVIILPRH